MPRKSMKKGQIGEETTRGTSNHNEKKLWLRGITPTPLLYILYLHKDKECVELFGIAHYALGALDVDVKYAHLC
jgi:hypothetical protein